MIYICVICMVKGPRLSPLTAEHRTLLKAIVSPFINAEEFQACHCQWLMCTNCKRLMQTLYNFQQTAVTGINNLKHLLHKLCTEQRRAKIEDTKLSVASIKIESGPVVSTSASKEELITVDALRNIEVTKASVNSIKIEPESIVSTSAPKEELITVEAPRNVNPLTEELDVKFEPEGLESEHEPGLESEYDSESKVSCESEVNGPSNEQPAISVSAPIIRPVQVLPMPATAGSEGMFEVFTHNPLSAQKPYINSIRPKDGARESSQKRVRKRSPRVPVPCPHCDKTMSDNCSLKAHIRRLHGELAPCKCDICGKQFRNEEVLKCHNRECHKKNTRTIDSMKPELFCKECCLEFRSPAAYKIHLKTLKHTPRDLYEFECGTCKMRFLDEKKLQLHVDVVHLRQKNHKCHICVKAFGQKKGLQSHIALFHEKSGQPLTLVCHLCGKTFTVRHNLKEHLLTHEGIRPHQCPLCPATFTYRAALYTHNKLKHLKIKEKWKKKKKVEKEGKSEEEKGAEEKLEP